ncbi:MAG: hypothetical protein ACYC26_17135 [Phycisphaerales bacterium]
MSVAANAYNYYGIRAYQQATGNNFAATFDNFNVLCAQPLDLSAYTVSSYGGASQDQNPSQYQIVDDGRTIRMWGNNWKALDTGGITITADTVLEFDFRSTGAEGEIAGIGLDTQVNNISSNCVFQLFGSQPDFGIQTYHDYAGNQWTHYTIPIGTFYTGTFDYLTFANDADAGQAADIFFHYIQFHT